PKSPDGRKVDRSRPFRVSARACVRPMGPIASGLPCTSATDRAHSLADLQGVENMQEFPSFRPLYDPTAVQPMRDELVRVGFRELRTPEEVDETFGNLRGTALLVVNSVCGCAAGNARPGA